MLCYTPAVSNVINNSLSCALLFVCVQFCALCPNSNVDQYRPCCVYFVYCVYSLVCTVSKCYSYFLVLCSTLYYGHNSLILIHGGWFSLVFALYIVSFLPVTGIQIMFMCKSSSTFCSFLGSLTV